MANCQWINNKCVNFYKIEHCRYMREGEGSIFLKICCFLHWIQSVNLHFLLPYIIMDLPILGTSELTKLLKIDIFVSLCDNSTQKRAVKQKI